MSAKTAADSLNIIPFDDFLFGEFFGEPSDQYNFFVEGWAMRKTSHAPGDSMSVQRPMYFAFGPPHLFREVWESHNDVITTNTWCALPLVAGVSLPGSRWVDTLHYSLTIKAYTVAMKIVSDERQLPDYHQTIGFASYITLQKLTSDEFKIILIGSPDFTAKTKDGQPLHMLVNISHKME